MPNKSDKKVAETAATIVLFAIVLGVSIALAGTDINVVVRVLLATVCGGLGAAFTFFAVGSRRR